MPDSEHQANSFDRKRQKIRARLLAMYQKTGERCDIAAAYELRKSDDPMTLDEHRYQKCLAIENPAKNPRHRPEIDDSLRLMAVVLHMALKKWPASKAARYVTKGISGNQSPDSTARRLTRKLRKIQRDLNKT